MKAINHPDYRYQPWTEERRERASRAAKQRIAAKRREVQGPPTPAWLIERRAKTVAYFVQQGFTHVKSNRGVVSIYEMTNPGLFLDLSDD